MNKIFYWSSRFVLLVFLGTMIFLSGITMALVIVRVLPFVSPLLNANINAISRSQGAQFINAAYPIGQNIPALQRMRMDPLVPLFIGVSILRKIKPIDNLLKRLVPPRNSATNPNNTASGSIPSPNFQMQMPDASSVFDSDGSLTGVLSGDNLNSVKGRFMNLGLSFLFLLIVAICVLISSHMFKLLIKSFNTQSKNLVRSTVQISEELKALPAILEELDKDSPVVKKKAVTRRKTK